jgi:hypothetical protein
MTVILEPALTGEHAQHPRLRRGVLGFGPPQRPQRLGLNLRR